MAALSQDKIIELNELYLEIGSYAGVSRAMGGSPAPATVKKYIIPNYVSQKNIEIRKFDISEIPSYNYVYMKDEDVCVLSEEEVTEIEELWKELTI